jgi:hypothetical protein
MNVKSRTAKERIYATFLDGNVIAYTRHNTARSAQSLVINSRMDTVEASIDDLMRIGKEGIEVGGIEPDADPNQQLLPIM